MLMFHITHPGNHLTANKSTGNKRTTMKKNFLTLVVVPHGGKRLVTLCIPYWLIALFIVAGIGIGLLVSLRIPQGLDQLTALRLRRENEILRERVKLFSDLTDTLSVRFRHLEALDTQVRVMADLDLIDEDIRALGVGGGALSDPLSRELMMYNTISGKDTETTKIRMDQLIRETEFQSNSFAEIIAYLEKEQTKRDHTPSIRPTQGWITCGYGPRIDPFTGLREFHSGADIAGPKGTPIYATADGRVKFAGRKGRLGKTVIIDHGDGVETLYGHLDAYKVRRGQRIKRWDMIGLMGRSGRATGPHLHYEVRISKRSVNPFKYMLTPIPSTIDLVPHTQLTHTEPEPNPFFTNQSEYISLSPSS